LFGVPGPARIDGTIRGGDAFGGGEGHEHRGGPEIGSWEGAPRSRLTVNERLQRGLPVTLVLFGTDLVLAFWFDFDFHGIEEWHQIRPECGSPDGELKMQETYDLYGWSGYPIRDFNDWQENGMPPERKRQQFVPGRSAYELSVLYTSNGKPTVPAVLRCILDSHDETKGVVIEKGKVELETPLPCSPRGNRCHDLAFDGSLPPYDLFISIEGKADEPFGDTVENEFQKALRRPVTDFPQRLEWLTQSLLGVPGFIDPQHKALNPAVKSMGYQLFAGLAATLLEARDRGAKRAIFIVHDFRTAKTSDAKMQTNAEALDSFLRLLLRSNGATNDEFKLERGRLLRFPVLPRRVYPALPSEIPLYIGKIRTDLLAATASSGMRL
jgi:hypothetical protein